MTAVVGILNMSAVAIAADSAVTITNQSNEKIFNNANKIFQLSKYHPVGLAIYGSGSLMFTPWEVVIKTYRNQLPKNGFDTITEYREDFLNYLQSNGYFSTQIGFNAKIATTLKSILDRFLNLIQNLVIGPNPQNFFALTAQQQTDSLKNTFKEQLKSASANLKNFPQHSGDYSQISQTELLSEFKASTMYQQVMNTHNVTTMGWVDMEVIQLIDDYLYDYLLTSDFSQSVPAGLVFVGYGNAQLYPQCHCVEIAEVIKGKLRWKVGSDTTISDSNQSAIMPYAQADVIDTIISGMSPDINRELLRQIEQMLSQHNMQVANLINHIDPSLAQHLRNGFNIGHLIQTLGQNMAAFQNNFSTGRTLESVRLFSKEDLAELAESLIYLTYLKRRMTFAQETVSKPVDVAVISKGDGFIWIKRKFYFDSNLNPHFLRNHFRE